MMVRNVSEHSVNTTPGFNRVACYDETFKCIECRVLFDRQFVSSVTNRNDQLNCQLYPGEPINSMNEDLGWFGIIVIHECIYWRATHQLEY